MQLIVVMVLPSLAVLGVVAAVYVTLGLLFESRRAARPERPRQIAPLPAAPAAPCETPPGGAAWHTVERSS